MGSRKKVLTLSDRMQARERALQRELKSVQEWLTTLTEMIELNPEDTWATGMKRHYLTREQNVRLAIDAVRTARGKLSTKSPANGVEGISPSKVP